LASLPLPILTFLLSVVAAGLIARRSFGVLASKILFVAFMVVVALGSLMVGLRFGYGVEQLIFVQRVLPLFAGPLLYLGFAVLCCPEGIAKRRIYIHLGAAVLIALGLQILAQRFVATDAVLVLSSLFYGVLIFLLWWQGPNHLRRARFDAVPGLRIGMLAASLFLVLSSLIDGAISVSFALGGEGAALQLISVASLVLASGMAAFIYALGRGRNDTEAAKTVSPDADDGVEADIRALLERTQLYLDKELTVERLSKRMGLPVRSVSGAINTETGLNVSQYVNNFRLTHAAGLLTSTDESVAAVMDQSGFLTRSNFYREFQRVYGMSPAAFRDAK